MKRIETYIGLLMLAGAISLNLWLYRSEPAALVDPNDNTFQFALVHRTNQIWDFANKTCSKNLSFALCHVSFLVDHWVPNWAQGYNLPYYYSHIPQILIVAAYRFVSSISEFFMKFSIFKFQISLFQFYHIIIYFLLSLFPLSVFWASRVIGLTWLAAGFGAVAGATLSTDGFYGLDPSSFVWRGYGLTSQLFAGFWLSLAIAYSYRWIIDKKSTRALLPAIFFLSSTTAGHLGIGMIAFLSVGVMAASRIVPLFYCSIAKNNTDAAQQCKKEAVRQCVNVLWLFGAVFLLLGYWIIPILLGGNYHNISYWDPIWKFDSYGAAEILTRLFNGTLFDFGRLPILTALVFVGVFSALSGAASGKIFADRFPSSKTDEPAPSDIRDAHAYAGRLANSGARKFFPELQPPNTSYLSFSILFLFWLLLYFGRTTWGPLVDLIPGMSEFHMSRFIVGVHASALFLIPIAIEKIRSRVPLGTCVLFVILSIFPLYRPVFAYASHNSYLISRANKKYTEVKEDTEALVSTLHYELSVKPGRVYPGRGGGWGRDFRVAETPMYLYLSTYGIPTILWMPQTWSPNADTEQTFDEGTLAHYILYNVRYVLTPAGESVTPQPFWKPIASGKTWKLYGIEGSNVSNVTQVSQVSKETHVSKDTSVSFFSSGIRPAIVASSKNDFKNLVRLWIQSDYHTLGLYPQLVLSGNTTMKQFNAWATLPHFMMTDEVTYETPDGKRHNLFAEPPVYKSSQQNTNMTVEDNTSEADMIFSARVAVPKNCTQCIVILKQTYHPSWKALLDGKPVRPFTVFPFFTAVEVPEGIHDIVFSYEPSGLKVSLLVVSIATFASFTFFFLKKQQTNKSVQQ